MSGDIEEFLRRAAARRARKSAPIVIDDQGVVEPERETVQEHVASRLDTSKFDERASQFGDATHETKLEAHIHDKFDKRLGTLAESTVGDVQLGDMQQREAPKHETVVISEIAELLRNPKSIRQAIILTEVLNPPHNRW